MDSRKEVYKELCKRLKAVQGVEIRHIDLWNENIVYIEQEEGWERPAVFVEFGAIQWKAFAGDRVQRGTFHVRLHIVTDWVGSAADGSDNQEEALEVFDLSEAIQAALQDMDGGVCSTLELVETHTNHNHEEIVESIEVYAGRCTRQIG